MPLPPDLLSTPAAQWADEEVEGWAKPGALEAAYPPDAGYELGAAWRGWGGGGGGGGGGRGAGGGPPARGGPL